MTDHEIFENANKFIFVDNYAEAFRLLEELTHNGQGQNNLVYQMRKIELSLKLNKVSYLRSQYAHLKLENKMMSMTCDICILFCELYNDDLDPKSAMVQFNKIMESGNLTAVCHFGLAICFESLGDLEMAISHYQSSLKCDPEWYPSHFGLSQAYYSKKDKNNGDYHFFLYEKQSPYSLYGNIETHQLIFREFVEAEMYKEASISITKLSRWWIDNKGSCPKEIKAIEICSLYYLSSFGYEAENHSVVSMIDDFLTKLDDSRLENTSFECLEFCSNIFLEYKLFQLIEPFYNLIFKKIINNENQILRIISHFISHDLYEEGVSVLNNWYYQYPESKVVRDQIMLLKMSYDQIDVDYYYATKNLVERKIKTVDDFSTQNDLLNSLVQIFDQDAEVFEWLGDCSLASNDLEGAQGYYQQMINIDYLGPSSLKKYISFHVKFSDIDRVDELLSSLLTESKYKELLQGELLSLTIDFSLQKKDFNLAIDYIDSFLKKNPWDYDFLVKKFYCLVSQKFSDNNQDTTLLVKLYEQMAFRKSPVDSKDWMQSLDLLRKKNAYDLIFLMRKIEFLDPHFHIDKIHQLTLAACDHDFRIGVNHLMKLVNQNYSQSIIYTTIGILHHDMWQLETATTWLEQALTEEDLTEDLKNFIYFNLADCYIWRQVKLQRAVQLLKSIDKNHNKDLDTFYIRLTHAYLLLGEPQNALETLKKKKSLSQNLESSYLQGLILYRNGREKQAQKLWKPCITYQTKTIREHHIKQYLLDYYFKKPDYLELG